MTDTSFDSLPLNSAELSNLERLGYKEMTDIQQKSLPIALSGADLIAKAKTGSGKTAAFALPMLHKLNAKNYYIQTLVLCPTRELAQQVAEEIRRLARSQHNVKVLTLCGGQSIGPQIGSLEHGAHIIVGTPGRIQDHLRKNTLDLSRLTTLVLDEADRMLEMGFVDAVEAIAGHSPSSRQTMLFSATYPEKIEALSRRLMKDPQVVSVDAQHSDTHIEQLFVEVERKEKVNTLLKLLSHYQPNSTVVFCNTKQETKEVSHAIYQAGGSSVALHGDLEQRDRDQVLVRFSQASACVLVATDVAARGLDIDDLALVVNYDIPRDVEVYIHRVGRTGRAGKSGRAVCIYSPNEAYKLEAIEDYRKQPISYLDPTELDESKPLSRPEWISLELQAGKRDKIRPGDLLGALTAQGGIQGSAVGNIAIYPNVSYIAIAKSDANRALKMLTEGRIKGRRFRARKAH
ncbi:ATP-dependent RNA helicase DbpA [Sinobacterium caligoides]|uniref:DEAD-box ATP-dependent RNA helicase RhpA n=1 Tax=Sinobacterium caligoides TaxID=933926 RepID=A0A3N2DXM7_9GAMM|nr:ATP-dependent RNA helicase DbpA [Sinobacterium caligoides]